VFKNKCTGAAVTLCLVRRRGRRQVISKQETTAWTQNLTSNPLSSGNRRMLSGAWTNTYSVYLLPTVHCEHNCPSPPLHTGASGLFRKIFPHPSRFQRVAEPCNSCCLAEIKLVSGLCPRKVASEQGACAPRRLVNVLCPKDTMLVSTEDLPFYNFVAISRLDLAETHALQGAGTLINEL